MVNNMIERKKEVEEIVEKSNNLMNKLIILDLLKKNNLNEYITKITDKKIYIKGPTIIKKGYLTEYEQFIYILDNFITYFMNIINNIELIYKVIPLLISNKKVFLSKKNYYDNDNIKYYNTEFNKIIISNFYKNLILYKNDLEDYLINLEIDLEKIDITKPDNIKMLLSLLEELHFTNRHRYGVIALFEESNSTNHNIFLTYYELIFSAYHKNIKFIKEYRKFKEINNIYISK